MVTVGGLVIIFVLSIWGLYLASFVFYFYQELNNPAFISILPKEGPEVEKALSKTVLLGKDKVWEEKNLTNSERIAKWREEQKRK